MLGKLHADPGEEEQGTKGEEKSTAKNCSKYQVQSISPIELPEAFHPSHHCKAASAVFTGPKLAGPGGSAIFCPSDSQQCLACAFLT